MKYIVFGPTWKPAKKLFDDMDDCADVFWKYDFFNNHILLRLLKSHLEGHLSNLPGKKLWPQIIKLPHLQKNEKVIFIYVGSDIVKRAIKCKMISYLSRKLPESKHIGYLMDIHSARRLDIKLLNNTLDKVYIFDDIEASRLGINYYPLPFSRGRYSDICYVGQDKGRLREIVKIYDRLSQHDVKCFFYLCNVPSTEQIKREGIVYGPVMDPEKSLQYIQNTNCILEVQIDDVSSYSDRVQKAIAYNKKILTNNQNLRRNKFYNDKMICIYNSIEEIDPSFVKNRETISYGYTDEYSPIHFLEQINIDLSAD